MAEFFVLHSMMKEGSLWELLFELWVLLNGKLETSRWVLNVGELWNDDVLCSLSFVGSRNGPSEVDQKSGYLNFGLYIVGPKICYAGPSAQILLTQNFTQILIETLLHEVAVEYYLGIDALTL